MNISRVILLSLNSQLEIPQDLSNLFTDLI